MKKIVYIAFVLLGNYNLFAQVGINTTTPQQELHVAGTGKTQR